MMCLVQRTLPHNRFQRIQLYVGFVRVPVGTSEFNSAGAGLLFCPHEKKKSEAKTPTARQARRYEASGPQSAYNTHHSYLSYTIYTYNSINSVLIGVQRDNVAVSAASSYSRHLSVQSNLSQSRYTPRTFQHNEVRLEANETSKMAQ
jgi:hypothetical protein